MHLLIASKKKNSSDDGGICQPCALKPQMYTGVFLSKNLYFARDVRVDGTAALFTHFLTQKSTHLSIRTENKLKETVRQQS